MNADSYYAMGKSHMYCQDYAASGLCNLGMFAIVADGCSSSKHTDVGARILIACAIRELHRAIQIDHLRSAIWRASNTISILGLPNESLDASLLLLQSTDMGVQVIMTGDGVLAVHRVGAEGCDIYDLEQRDNCPEYLNYITDFNRHSNYQQQFAGGTHIVHHGNGEARWTRQLDDPFFTIYFSYQDIDKIAVFSDGVKSIEELPLGNVIESLMNFKNTTGFFVQRRLKRFLKTNANKDIYPHDDVSMAAIVI